MEKFALLPRPENTHDLYVLIHVQISCTVMFGVLVNFVQLQLVLSLWDLGKQHYTGTGIITCWAGVWGGHFFFITHTETHSHIHTCFRDKFCHFVFSWSSSWSEWCDQLIPFVYWNPVQQHQFSIHVHYMVDKAWIGSLKKCSSTLRLRDQSSEENN